MFNFPWKRQKQKYYVLNETAYDHFICMIAAASALYAALEEQDDIYFVPKEVLDVVDKDIDNFITGARSALDKSGTVQVIQK